MAGLMDRLRGLLAPAAPVGVEGPRAAGASDDKIALGVLLWIVAEADGKFLDSERDQIEAILRKRGVPEDDLAVVMAAVAQAAKDRIDLYAFTREVAAGLVPAARAEIVKSLFRVACADGAMDHDEVETIRQISSLLRVPHRDMIDAKLAAKAEAGLE